MNLRIQTKTYILGFIPYRSTKRLMRVSIKQRMGGASAVERGEASLGGARAARGRLFMVRTYAYSRNVRECVCVCVCASMHLSLLLSLPLSHRSSALYSR
jgi:hypothetical protein